MRREGSYGRSGGDGAGAGPPSVCLHSPLPSSVETGRGQFVVVSGDCLAPAERIDTIHVSLDGRREAAELSPIPGGVSFWQAVLLPRDRIGRSCRLQVLVRLGSGQEIPFSLGETRCRKVRWQPVSVPGELPRKGLIAICMATYHPQLHAFQRQVDSIRAQTYDNWICIVNDDGTPSDAWEKMRRHCAGDERFRFTRNGQNLGFYHNFEQSLKRVPAAVEYVALSDQDDVWYPTKLSRLVRRLRETGATLVYSDMRVVDADGNELAPSYWINRKNEYRDLEALLVANTVTGAASLFRRDLLDLALPFPPRVGDAFHDHWLACVALSTGKIGYVDAPLYDYYQYGGSVIGHCDFVRFSLLQRLASLIRFCSRMCRPSEARPTLRRKYVSALAIYRGECRRLRLVGNTLQARCRLTRRAARQLDLFNGGVSSVAKLLWLHGKVVTRGKTTDDAELRLAMGSFARLVEQRRKVRVHAAD